MASPPNDPAHPERGGVDLAQLPAYFVKSGPYTAGVGTHYPPATCLIADGTHQALAGGFTLGMRFHSAPVIHLADAQSSRSSVRRLTPPGAEVDGVIDVRGV